MTDESIEYYNRNADRYIHDTVEADMGAHYPRFERHLPPGGRVLDAGCGSGRDSLHFLRQGYQVEAFDASREMVRRCADLTGLPVRLARFEDVAYDEPFDGIWACASLLHVRKPEMAAVLGRLASLLTDGGVFFLSYKYGDQDYTKEGRTFTCYTEASFADLLRHIPALSLLDLYITGDVRPGREHERWLSVIVGKGSEQT